MTTCESAYKQVLEIVNNSAIPSANHPMPHHINRHSLPVSRVQGYSVLTDTNKDSVFTCLDLPRMDRREVVPYLSAEYPSMDEVCFSPFYSSFFYLSP